MCRIILSVFVLMVLAVPALAGTGHWNVDPDRSNVQFEIQNMLFPNVRGHFSEVNGKVWIDDQDATQSKVRLIIAVDSLNTGTAKWDRFLKSPKFLDSTRFTVFTFVSKRVEKDHNGKLKVVGDLSLRGVSKEIGVEVHGLNPKAEDYGGHTRVGALATTKINRKDFGITWNGLLDNGGLLVGEEVEITIDLELVRKSELTKSLHAKINSEVTEQAATSFTEAKR